MGAPARGGPRSCIQRARGNASTARCAAEETAALPEWRVEHRALREGAPRAPTASRSCASTRPGACRRLRFSSAENQAVRQRASRSRTCRRRARAAEAALGDQRFVRDHDRPARHAELTREVACRGKSRLPASACRRGWPRGARLATRAARAAARLGLPPAREALCAAIERSILVQPEYAKKWTY